MGGIALTNEQIATFNFRSSPDAWQTKWHERLKLPFPLPWVLIAAALFFIGLLLTTHTNHRPNVEYYLGMECFLIAFMANCVIYFEMLMDKVAETYPALLDEQTKDARRWIIQWYHRIFWTPLSHVFSFGMAMAIVLVYYKTGLRQLADNTGIEYAFLKNTLIAYEVMILFVMGFLGGSMLWTMVGIALMFFSLGKAVKLKVSIFSSKNSALRIASSVLYKISIAAVLTYILGLITQCSCEGVPFKAKLTTAIFGIIILGYFIIPQLNIHKTLAKIKDSRLLLLAGNIDHAFDMVAAEPSKENINNLKELFHIHGVVNGKSTWNFGWDQFIKLASTILIPQILFGIKNHAEIVDWFKSIF